MRDHGIVAARDDLKSALRDVVGPALRAEGFKGSGAAWYLRTPGGDCALVNVQRSQFGSAADVRCVVNIAVAPEPWLAWNACWQGVELPKAPKDYDGLWRARCQPSWSDSGGSETWWAIHDEATAQAAAHDIVFQVTAQAVPVLRRLLDRREMIATVRAGDLGFITAQSSPEYFARALAVLLADQGQSRDLDALLDHFGTTKDADIKKYNLRFIPWLNHRATSRSGPS